MSEENEMKKSHTLPGVIVTRSKEPLVICMGCGEGEETIKRYKQALEKFAEIYGSGDKVENLALIDWVVKTAKETLKEQDNAS